MLVNDCKIEGIRVPPRGPGYNPFTPWPTEPNANHAQRGIVQFYARKDDDNNNCH